MNELLLTLVKTYYKTKDLPRDFDSPTKNGSLAFARKPNIIFWERKNILVHLFIEKSCGIKRMPVGSKELSTRFK